MPVAISFAIVGCTAAISPAMLYAYAAIASDTPYANFTPSVAADVAPGPSATPVFFLSDSTGISAETMGNALLIQFPQLRFERRLIPFITTPEEARRVVEVLEHPVDAHEHVVTRHGGLPGRGGMVDRGAATGQVLGATRRSRRYISQPRQKPNAALRKAAARARAVATMPRAVAPLR